MWWPKIKSKNSRQADGWTPYGLPITLEVTSLLDEAPAAKSTGPRLHLEYLRLKLLRGFDHLLCLEGLRGVEHLPHQVETVRKVLKYFHGRVLLADEVGLGKTIEACLLLREYLLRGLVGRVLILVPSPLVDQWRDELISKFSLEFAVPDRRSVLSKSFQWAEQPRVLTSISLAKSNRHFESVAEIPWDLVIIDEAHHCKHRATKNWQLVNSLKRRYLFLLTATPVQNNLLDLYNLLTLLEPGHLRTETDFKKGFVRRGNPRDPINREKLRSLLGEVMIRNTRSLVSLDLPKRYAQTFVVQPTPVEADLYRRLAEFIRARSPQADPAGALPGNNPDAESGLGSGESDLEEAESRSGPTAEPDLFSNPVSRQPVFNRMRINTLLLAAGSHPAALASSLLRYADQDPLAGELAAWSARLTTSAKEKQLIELLRRALPDKVLVFTGLRATLQRLHEILGQTGIAHRVFTGAQTPAEKLAAVNDFREHIPVLLCSELGGEGHNLQFANTMINFDLPWNPMRIEQRVGRIHRIGQTRDVFIFNLCTAGSVEERILRLLDDKIRMFELVIGEVGSILGNLEGGDEFESLILDMWLSARNDAELDRAFERLGDNLLQAQAEYLRAKELDEALFGDDYE